MALTNILREPRREITETIVGLAVVGTFFYADYTFAAWLSSLDPPRDSKEAVGNIIFGMLLGLVVVILMLIIAFAAHLLGEILCDALETRGIRLRPRRPAQ